jgi:hypothetical protein
MEEKKENDLKISIKRTQFKNHKSCSSSSIFLDTTIASPDVKNMIKAVSIMLFTQLTEDKTLTKKISEKSDLYYFSEEKYIKEYPQYFDLQKIENIHKEPTIDEIIDFIEALYNCVQFSSECCIIGLIYINRIIALTGLSLQNTNWRPLIFVSLMMSQKIWDDRYLSNGDFSSIYPFFEKEDLNLLEMKFLEIIQYNVFVKLSIYMTFYLELRMLVKGQLSLKPLNKFEIRKMEHFLGEKRSYQFKRNNSQGKFFEEGERSNYIIN